MTGNSRRAHTNFAASHPNTPGSGSVPSRRHTGPGRTRTARRPATGRRDPRRPNPRRPNLRRSWRRRVSPQRPNPPAGGPDRRASTPRRPDPYGVSQASRRVGPVMGSRTGNGRPEPQRGGRPDQRSIRPQDRIPGPARTPAPAPRARIQPGPQSPQQVPPGKPSTPGLNRRPPAAPPMSSRPAARQPEPPRQVPPQLGPPQQKPPQQGLPQPAPIRQRRAERPPVGTSAKSPGAKSQQPGIPCRTRQARTRQVTTPGPVPHRPETHCSSVRTQTARPRPRHRPRTRTHRSSRPADRSHSRPCSAGSPVSCARS